MRIPIDRESRVPLYQQVEDFLRQSILTGVLQPETRLPSTRQLASDLGVNRLTIVSAYAGLEADGLIATRAGSGTYILAPLPQPKLPTKDVSQRLPLWQQELALRMAARPAPPAPSAARLNAPALIDLASGSGDAHLFPVEDYRRAIQSALRKDGMQALGYGEPEGHPPLRETIAHILSSQGIPTRPEQVLITSGSQQAISLVSHLLLEPGDTILVESPTYAIALALFRALNLKVVGVPVDEHGMIVDALEPLLQQHHPRLIYTIPNFHNPTGACLSLARRQQLIELGDRYNLPILEDDYVGDLRYEGHNLPALKALDPGGRVIYASTFSKMIMPGLRVGFLVVDGPVYAALVDYKRVNDLSTANLHQRALEAYVTVGRYQAHLRRTTQLYRRRRDTMIEAINRYLPASVEAKTPQGGLFLWLSLPDAWSAETLLPLAQAEGVSFAPGYRFFPEPARGKRFLRLNFASQTPDQIVEGIKRLGKALRQMPA